MVRGLFVEFTDDAGQDETVDEDEKRLDMRRMKCKMFIHRGSVDTLDSHQGIEVIRTARALFYCDTGEDPRRPNSLVEEYTYPILKSHRLLCHWPE